MIICLYDIVCAINYQSHSLQNIEMNIDCVTSILIGQKMLKIIYEWTLCDFNFKCWLNVQNIENVNFPLIDDIVCAINYQSHSSQNIEMNIDSVTSILNGQKMLKIIYEHFLTWISNVDLIYKLI